MSRADELHAELAVVQYEDELVRLKGLKRPDPKKVHETKTALRDARRRFRELRAGEPAAAGDAVASPDTVAVTAEVSEV